MGGNRTLPAADYPHAFHSALAAGGAVLYAADLPWTPISAAKRFRLFLALIRRSPGHPLREQARKRWRVQPGPEALVLGVSNYHKGETPSLTEALIERALT